MSLRAQLVIAFVLLAVLPLTGISVYSYVSSERAYRRAVERETASMARDMEQRMSAATEDLSRRLERLRQLPLEPLLADGGGPVERERVLRRVEAELGDVAPYVESVEFLAAPPAPEGPQSGALAAAPADAPRIVLAPSSAADAPAPPRPPEPAGAGAADFEMPELGEDVPEPVRWVVRRVYEHAQRRADAAADPEATGDHTEPTPAQADVPDEALEAIEDGLDKLADAMQEKAATAEDDWAAGLLAAGSRMAAAALKTHRVEVKRLLGRAFEYTFEIDGLPQGRVQAKVRAEEVVRHVLERTPRSQGELPFAVDGAGKRYARSAGDLARLEALPVATAGLPRTPESRDENWIIVTRQVPDSELTLGIARPIGDGLRELRATAARNLAYGLAIAVLAFVGILPLTKRMTRNLDGLTLGAEAISAGDLDARVPVRSSDEFGRLAETFNRMAESLHSQRQQLVQQERLKKELELSRRIQEELLPRTPLRAAFGEVKGLSIPAREVGGDFFDYFTIPDGRLAVLVGDVSGKGMGAALLMANAQARLRAGLPLEKSLVDLALHLDDEIAANTPSYVYLTLFMALLDPEGRRLSYVNAGHHTQFLLRAAGDVEQLASTGRPLGLLPGGGFESRSLEVASGDTLFLFTDGLVEMEDARGEPFGSERLSRLVRDTRHLALEELLEQTESAVRAHRAGTEALDDATLLALKIA